MAHRTLSFARAGRALSKDISVPKTGNCSNQLFFSHSRAQLNPHLLKVAEFSVSRSHFLPVGRRTFSSSSSRRASLYSPSNIRQAYRNNPVSFSIAVACIVTALGLIGYSYKIYKSYIIDEFAAYPDPVAKQLRRALYYSNIAPDPEKANQFFKKALEKCRELQMDPYSDEVVGIKLAVADMLEKAKDIPSAIEVLEHVKKDLTEWVEKNGAMHFEDGDRTRILSRTVGIGFKLGELYSWLADTDAAYTSTLWAVSVIVGEKNRRDQMGVREGEGEWLSGEEVGAALEALALVFQNMDKPHLAVPLYLEALGHCPKDDCHAAVLMSNLAVAIMEQNPYVVKQLLDKTAPGKDHQPIPMGEQARKWFQVAIRYAQTDLLKLEPSAATILPQLNAGKPHPVAAAKQTPECDQACLSALYGLGELAEREKNPDLAKQFYSLSLRLATKIGYTEPQDELKKAVERVNKLVGTAVQT